MRVYVLITSFDPLRIYVYDEGLTRFASEAYKHTSSKANNFVHLTNYSINKKNTSFVKNETANEDNFGHKWSLSALMKHIESLGLDSELLWNRIYDLVIKTVISCEDEVVTQIRRYGLNRSNWFDLLGFDILLDAELNPWLMEVNLCPSLATESPLD